MARDFGKVRTAFWADDRVQAWPERIKFMALYLLTAPHANAIGCFRAPIQYIAADTGLPALDVRHSLEFLQQEDFLRYCNKTGFVLIKKFLSHNCIENPKVGSHCIKLAMALPRSLPFLAEIEAVLKAALVTVKVKWDGFGYPIETVSEPYRTPEPEPEPEPETERDAGEKIRPPHLRQVWPENAVVPENWVKAAAGQRKMAGLPEIDLRALALMFANHYAADRANPRTVTEYQAKWNNWALKEKVNDRPNGNSKNTTSDTIRELARMAAQADGEPGSDDFRQ